MDFAKTLDDLLGSADKAVEVYGKKKAIDTGNFETVFGSQKPMGGATPTYTPAVQEAVGDASPQVQISTQKDNKLLWILGGLFLFMMLN